MKAAAITINDGLVMSEAATHACIEGRHAFGRVVMTTA